MKKLRLLCLTILGSLVLFACTLNGTAGSTQTTLPLETPTPTTSPYLFVKDMRRLRSTVSMGAFGAAGDIDGLAQSISELLADPDLRRRMAEAAREGLGEFDREAMVRQQEDLYRWMCSRSIS